MKIIINDNTFCENDNKMLTVADNFLSKMLAGKECSSNMCIEMTVDDIFGKKIGTKIVQKCNYEK